MGTTFLTGLCFHNFFEGTANGLDECDRDEYRSIIEPLATHFGKLIEEILGPVQHIPHHPLLLATFGAMAYFPQQHSPDPTSKGRELERSLPGYPAGGLQPQTPCSLRGVWR
jgi:hypothetical protein